MTTLPPNLPPSLQARKPSPGPWQVFLIIVEGALVVAILDIHLFVVPRFMAIFAEQGHKLPWLTRMILLAAGWRFLFIAFLWMLAYGFVTFTKFCLKNATVQAWFDVIFLLASLGYIALVMLGLYMPYILDHLLK